MTCTCALTCRVNGGRRAAAALQLVDELVEARRAEPPGATAACSVARILPTCSRSTSLPPRASPLDLRPHLAGVHGAAVADGHAGAPLPHDEAAVGELVGEQREAQHRHPGPRALQDGVPAAVREEGGDGGWASTSTWQHHGTTTPRPSAAAAAAKPSGSGSGSSELTMSGRITHRNRAPLASTPRAISWSRGA